MANSWEFGSGYYGASTGLVKLGQRFYDPSLGRWTQQDPVPSGNLYLYTGDNPVNFVDPSGRDDMSGGCSDICGTATLQNVPPDPSDVFGTTGPLGFSNDMSKINEGAFELGLAIPVAFIPVAGPYIAGGLVANGGAKLLEGALGI